MKVFKFGGASVKDAQGVENVAGILSKYPANKILVVVSAMGKTTNALESLTNAYFHQTKEVKTILEEIKNFHDDIAQKLFNNNHPIFTKLNNIFVEIEWVLEDTPAREFAFIYDQIVSAGEILSSTIVSEYLNAQSICNLWFDARDCIKTDDTYREAQIIWDETTFAANNIVSKLFQKNNIAVTQGFIGVTNENNTTTLGREGSDFSAAIFAYALDAESVTIWKDVPGVLNADPKWFSNTQKLDMLSYSDAIELTYYGATVIHPKTIKPLQNKEIPLYVRSFLDIEQDGTVISKDSQTEPLIPSFIFKVNQVLLSISAKNFSFILEEHMGLIFNVFAKLRVKVNLIQLSAISFSACFDYDKEQMGALLSALQDEFKVLYNKELELVTIRHYNQATIERVTEGKAILLEQKSRHTAQIVMSPQ